MYIGAKCESNSMRIQASQKRNKVMTVATQGLNEEIAYTQLPNGAGWLDMEATANSPRNCAGIWFHRNQRDVDILDVVFSRIYPDIRR